MCDAAFFRFRRLVPLCLSVCLSFLLFLHLAVRTYQMGSQWTDYFHENCYWRLLLKCVEKLNILLKSNVY